MTSEYDRLMSLLRGRRSIRRFRADPVPDASIEKVLEAARWAPSAANRQAYRFIAVASRDLIEKMSAAVGTAARAVVAEAPPAMSGALAEYVPNFSRFESAPLLVAAIVRADHPLDATLSRDGTDAIASVSAAIMNMLLAVHALGLGACWMTGPLVAEREMAELLDVPAGWKIAALVPIGVPDEAPPPPPRRDLSRLWQYRGRQEEQKGKGT